MRSTETASFNCMGTTTTYRTATHQATHQDLQRAYEQASKFIEAHDLPGTVEKGLEEDYRLQNREVMVVVESEEQLEQWNQVTRPYQLERIQGIHDHGEAKPISDAVKYVVVRQDGADGVIGGAATDSVQPIIDGWVLWVRYYPNGRTIYERPPTDQDLFPGRGNSFTLRDRPGQRPMTGSYVPHQQLTEQSPAELYEELLQWMETAFPGTRTGSSLVSDSTTVALHLNDTDKVRGRMLMPVPGFTEFGHVHEDGSLHLALTPEDRWELIVKDWGEAHPAAKWGVNAVMLYAPRNHEELEIAKKAFTAAYRHAIGEVS